MAPSRKTSNTAPQLSERQYLTTALETEPHCNSLAN